MIMSLFDYITRYSTNMIPKLMNLVIVAGGSMNLLEWLKLANFNQMITIVTGIVGVAFLIVKTIDAIVKLRITKLQESDEKLHISKEKEQLKQMRINTKNRRNKPSNLTNNK